MCLLLEVREHVSRSKSVRSGSLLHGRSVGSPAFIHLLDKVDRWALIVSIGL